VSAPGASFREGHVEADGFRIRYVEAGRGAALVHLHGAGGLMLTPAHDLLARDRRVIAFEMPGFGQSSENTRTRTMSELAATMTAAIDGLGIETFDLMGSSFGAKTALWIALTARERVRALVLEGPATIRPEGATPPSGSPEEIARRLYAHPERASAIPLPDPAVRARTQPLVARLRGPDRDVDLEERLRELRPPTLVLFGTQDAVIPSTMGRFYPALIPRCHLVFVYDAGHVISVDRPEAFSEAVHDFLEHHETFVVRRTPTLIHP
jgi:pimeloyl-ACP methyl ester carboxylesterase